MQAFYAAATVIDGSVIHDHSYYTITPDIEILAFVQQITLEFIV